MEEETKKYAMIGYYPNEVSGHVYAVGNEGVTTQEAHKRADEEGLELFQLFPLRGQPTGQHRFYKLKEGGGYKQGESREFAARLSAHVGGLIAEDEAKY